MTDEERARLGAAVDRGDIGAVEDMVEDAGAVARAERDEARESLARVRDECFALYRAEADRRAERDEARALCRDLAVAYWHLLDCVGAARADYPLLTRLDALPWAREGDG